MNNLEISGCSWKDIDKNILKSPEMELGRLNVLKDFQENRQICDASISLLYDAIMYYVPKERAIKLMNFDFLIIVILWLETKEVKQAGLENLLTGIHRRQMVELIEVVVRAVTQTSKVAQRVMLVLQRILSSLHRMISASNDVELRSSYLTCISRIFKFRPEIIDIQVYVELLVSFEGRSQEFYDLIQYYFKLKFDEMQPTIIDILLKQLTRRMRKQADKGVSTKGFFPELTNKRNAIIIRAYKCLISLLENSINTGVLQHIIDNCLQIVGFLHIFARSFSEEGISTVFNPLVSIMIRQQLANEKNFGIVLEIFKRFLQESPSVVQLLSTEGLRNKSFLLWVFCKEITYQKKQEVVQTYLKKAQSLKFFMNLTMIFLEQFPQHTQRTAAYIKSISLLQESFVFINLKTIERQLEAFFTQINERKVFEDFMTKYFRE